MPELPLVIVSEFEPPEASWAWRGVDPLSRKAQLAGESRAGAGATGRAARSHRGGDSGATHAALADAHGRIHAGAAVFPGVQRTWRAFHAAAAEPPIHTSPCGVENPEFLPVTIRNWRMDAKTNRARAASVEDSPARLLPARVDAGTACAGADRECDGSIARATAGGNLGGDSVAQRLRVVGTVLAANHVDLAERGCGGNHRRRQWVYV